MIASLLIANRGEIACRIIRTARRLGIRTIAVYSDADAKAMHVREADEAVHIGPSAARESYLVGEKIIAAARASGAEAIHPGYGFLSENATFAQSVIDAGLLWVGPKPASITAMGLKDAAKRLMDEAGVPTTPGYLGDDQSPARLQAEADAIGYPVLIKAVAGGGGKGMRRVDSSTEFADSLQSCQREAAASFGDDRVLIEKYILSPRHIEVQVFGDTHGNVIHLFERDCSLQRRHQKVIEEAPAPGMDEATRAAICAAAVKAAKAVDYVGAGTIEFIADASEGLRADRIWFMEMNTRLQVEHPVTEEITGQDLVEWQLRVASGERLPKTQEELSINGWAMEARLYAEDPVKGFLPSTGPLTYCDFPYTPHSDFPHAFRIDTGVEEGDVISAFYDPMVAKLIAHADTRAEAIEGLATWSQDVKIWPVKTNINFLIRSLRDPEFIAGNVHTGFISERLDLLVSSGMPSDEALQSAANFLYLDAIPDAGTERYGGVLRRDDWLQRNPWTALGLDGFRVSAQPVRKIRISADGKTFEVDIADPQQWSCWVERVGDSVLTNKDGEIFAFTTGKVIGAAAASESDGSLISPMPGRVIAVDAQQGDAVTKGQKLVTLEAMKMEHNLVAPFDGVVGQVDVNEGSQVSEGTLLVRVDPAD